MTEIKYDKKAFFDWLINAIDLRTVYNGLIKEDETEIRYLQNRLTEKQIQGEQAEVLKHILKNPNSPEAKDVKNVMDKIGNLLIEERKVGRTIDYFYLNGKSVLKPDLSETTEIAKRIEKDFNELKKDFDPQFTSLLAQDISSQWLDIQKMVFSSSTGVEDKGYRSKLRETSKSIEKIVKDIQKNSKIKQAVEKVVRLTAEQTERMQRLLKKQELTGVEI